MSAVTQHTVALHQKPASSLVFDEDHFARQTFGDSGLQQEIIQLFIAQVEDARKALGAPMTTTAWRFMTHTLKGAAGAVGAVRLAELAAAWELAGSPKDAAARQSVVSQFEDETAQFIAAARPYRN